jgi:hypothetical protein
MQDLCAGEGCFNALENIVKMSKPRDVVVWWEIRRIPYNAALLVVGLGSLFAVEAIGGRMVRVGEDFIEPLILLFAVLLYAIGANVCYTLGWITELLWSAGDIGKTEGVRQKVFRIGLLFSVGLTGLPGLLMIIIWALRGSK